MAMENKALNIFNSRLILASPETATDMDYARIEGVVAHGAIACDYGLRCSFLSVCTLTIVKCLHRRILPQLDWQQA